MGKRANIKKNCLHTVMGIDPGKQGALVMTDKKQTYIKVYKMPLDKEGFVSFGAVQDILEAEMPEQIILERAKAMAMGSTHAFNYGRDFQTLVLCLQMNFFNYELVDPSVWHKQLLGDVDKDLKPKVRCEAALKRMYPKLYKQMPKAPRSGKLLDGPVDATLLAMYGFLKDGNRGK